MIRSAGEVILPNNEVFVSLLGKKIVGPYIFYRTLLHDHSRLVQKLYLWQLYCTEDMD